jgi:capsular polysaccharide biosynthesis protein
MVVRRFRTLRLSRLGEAWIAHNSMEAGDFLPMNSVEPRSGASSEMARDEYSISENGTSIGHLLGVLWRRLWTIVLVVLVLTSAVVGFDLLRTPTYEATIKILIKQKQEKDISPDLGNEVLALEQLTQTLTEAIDTRPVALGVIDRLNLRLSVKSFLENLSVEQVPGTQFIEVSYEAEDPVRAAQIANAVGAVFSDQASKANPTTNAITATVWEEAAVPNSDASPNMVRDALLALVLGGMLGVGLAFLLEQHDDRLRSPEDVEEAAGVPSFGGIPEFNVSKSKKGIDRTRGSANRLATYHTWQRSE